MEIKTSNTILYCRKWKECLVFYKTQLGLKVNMEKKWFLEFKLNKFSRLSIADEAKTSIMSNEGKGTTISLEVVDIIETHLFLKEAGVHPPPIKDHPWGAKVIYIYDPEGNRIEFWEKIDKSINP